MSLVSQERVQQRTAEVPVEVVSLVSQERVQDRSLQRTVERARDFVQVDRTIPQDRISEQMYERSD